MADMNTDRKGLIICISGPSGAGKGTVVAGVRALIPDMATSVSVTTRPPRGTEQEGVDYYYRTKEQFQDMIARGEILEHDVYCDNYYGTPSTHLRKMSEQGTDTLLDLTVLGSINLKKIFGDTALIIFLMPPSMEVLESRLRNRGTDSEEKIAQRLETAAEEIGRKDEFDYVVVNDDLDTAIAEVMALIDRKRSEQGLN
ncbi:guanylate kinase [Ruminococcaceae bacterium YRB3002]|nr:guanylate kinase [Ruminococcaceae bacterium YRB3002]